MLVTPSISWFPDYLNSYIKTVFVDLLLSKRVSVPTSNLPTYLGSILYFSSKFWTTVKDILFTSSYSKVKAISNYPKPMVYFPLSILLKVSKSSYLTKVYGK